MTRIVLFDIDGTLLASGGAGRRAMEGALLAHFGTAGPSGYRYDGKTDRQIARESMRMSGFTDADIDDRMESLLADYLTRLAQTVTTDGHGVRVHAGIPGLLDALEARDDVLLGLLTGNIAPGASLKLRAAGLSPARFLVGAFGSDHEHRPELPAIAQRRAAEWLGRDVAGSSLVIIGDTPADIACGRGVGARAVAVATGHYSAADLASHAPHAVFDDFTDVAAAVVAICDA
ncbi:MAG: haloacid dehalogenase-like hydrolase [Gemmatimonadota bacterium]|nr:haloacid dehalogenase-like hydrolase [Gemmatimonadota bacterium]